ncbi:hypothetical protein ACHAXT_007130 [Thalassiosira profunda]
MLLEEALAGKSAAPGTPQQSLSPHDEALAVLSFVRDELPAGGTAAERRFVTLFPLIVNRVFGEINAEIPPEPLSPGRSPTPGASPSVTSPGGSQYSDPVNNAAEEKKDYRHVEGGWLSLTSTPTSQPRGTPGGAGSPIHSPLRASGSSSARASLENDPVVRLLRAPRKRDAGGGNFYAPTLLDALSAESVHRPSVRFKLPLAGLEEAAQPLVDDWKACFWGEFEGEAAKVANASASRGGFGVPAAQSQAGDDKTDGKPSGNSGKENATRILLKLLAGGPKDQVQLRSHFQQLYQQKHRSQGQHSFGTFGSPSRAPFASPMRTTAAKSTGKVDGPSLELTLLEYYLFLFVRFPLANVAWPLQLEDQKRRQRQYGGRPTSPYGQRVYSNLFSSYLNYYLGQGRAYATGRLGVGADCFDGLALAPAASAAAPSNSATSLDRTSELFLRLILEFWVEGQNVAPTMSAAIAQYRRLRSGTSASQTAAQPSLSDSMELSQPKAAFVSPVSQVQVGVLNLVRHLVSDKSTRELVQGVSGSLQQRQREDRGGAGTPPLVSDPGAGATSQTTASTGSIQAVPWCLPPAMTAAQPSVFNYIRLGLACGRIHDRSSVFHRALEAWLVWLEPWNYVMKRRPVVTRSSSNAGSGAGAGARGAGEFLRNAASTVTSHSRMEYYPAYVQPKPASPSKYSAQWEAYVLSNVHFYTVPLAIFLKRARELDFSGNTEFPRSLALVQRVMRIYSKAVVNVLNGVLNRRADALSTSLFDRHAKNMCAFCPPSSWKLSECQVDATNLLEEVFGQHQKRKAAMDFFDRMEAKISAIGSGKVGGEEATLEALLSQKVLPEEPRAARGGLWRLLDFGATESGAGTAASFPDRGPDGKLTDLGRQQLNAGLCKCNPLDVHYIGDPMLSRVKSYEIPILVELAILASNYLNAKLGLVAPTTEEEASGDSEDDVVMKRYREMERYQKVGFRVNLRFLADSRNIIFGAIVWWMLRTVGGVFRG